MDSNSNHNVACFKRQVGNELDEARAADVPWYLVGPESYGHLVVERGSPVGVYEGWRGDTLIALLLR